MEVWIALFVLASVLCLGEAWFVEQFQRGKGSKVRDRFGVCRMPGRGFVVHRKV